MAMEESKFWDLIADAREQNKVFGGDLQDLVDLVQARLEELEDDDVAAFQQQMLAQYCKAFDYRIIGATYVIVGEDCDEDDLHGFRGWLISQGEEFFKRTLADPDSLADAPITRNRVYLPELVGIGSEVYEASTGDLPPADPNFQLPEGPSGEEFDPTELPTRLPNLCAEWSFEIEGADDEEDAGPEDPVEAMLALVDAQVAEAAQAAEAEAEED